MKLKVKVPDGMYSPGTEIYVDDKKLRNVTRIKLNVAVDEIPEATITFIPEGVEVNGDFLIGNRLGEGEEVNHGTKQNRNRQ